VTRMVPTTRAPEVTEAQFLEQVLQLAKIFGWRTAPFRPAKTTHGWRTAVQGDGKGFPDLVLVRPPQIIFAELKSAKGSIGPEQAEWLTDIDGCDIPAYVWRPRDLDDIAQILKPIKAAP
jgi:hypothetical protein